MSKEETPNSPELPDQIIFLTSGSIEASLSLQAVQRETLLFRSRSHRHTLTPRLIQIDYLHLAGGP